MRRLLALALLSIFVAAPAWGDEKDYGMRGQVELGGTLGFARDSVSGNSSTNVKVNPFVGFFIIPSVEILGTLLVDYTKAGGGSQTSFGLVAGGGYFFPVSSIHLGPQLQIGFNHISPDMGDSQNAFVANAQLVLKVQVGNAGLVDLGAGYQYSKYFGDAGFSQNSILFNLGFSIFF